MIDSHKFILEAQGHPTEAVVVKFQEWDSEVLGLKCAIIAEMNSIEQGTPVYSTLVEEFKRLGLQYVTVRRHAGEWLRIQALEAAGFRMIDGIFQFRKDLPGKDFPGRTSSASESIFRLATAADAERVGRLAVDTFKLSRFHNDPVLTHAQAERVHFEWGKNTCLGRTAQAVWLAEKGEDLAGFITCSLHKTGSDGRPSGSIGLVAVADRFSGQGLGGALIGKAWRWFVDEKCHEIRVQTQIDNFAAMRLYSKAGFEAVSTSVTLRWANVHDSRSAMK
jgi:ribosomal protein S18 acetylase RimI-like enzyme